MSQGISKGEVNPSIIEYGSAKTETAEIVRSNPA
jgi:hypothetical protein